MQLGVPWKSLHSNSFIIYKARLVFLCELKGMQGLMRNMQVKKANLEAGLHPVV